MKPFLGRQDALNVDEVFPLIETWIERFWRDYHGESSRNRPVNTGESVL
jgi:hypothetical protein